MTKRSASHIRRLVVRAGAVAAIGMLAACIFDESTYKGGGRKDQRTETDQLDVDSGQDSGDPDDTGATSTDSGGLPDTASIVQDTGTDRG